MRISPFAAVLFAMIMVVSHAGGAFAAGEIGQPRLPSWSRS